MTPRSRRAVAVAFGLVAIVVALAAASCGGDESGAPSVEDPNAEGTALVENYFGLLASKDVSGLDELLAPDFQVVRANGNVQDKTSYLENPPDVEDFTLRNVATRVGENTLTVSYQVNVAEVVAGAEEPSGWSPRLSVFEWQDGAWRLVAHANFGAIR
jgi:hypothetical protein